MPFSFNPFKSAPATKNLSPAPVTMMACTSGPSLNILKALSKSQPCFPVEGVFDLRPVYGIMPILSLFFTSTTLPALAPPFQTTHLFCMAFHQASDYFDSSLTGLSIRFRLNSGFLFSIKARTPSLWSEDIKHMS